MAKERFIVLDVEGQQTCRPYNVGYIIADRYGKIYKKRSDRPEWIRVNLLGKCIVVDDGTCKPGHWCTIGENGIAIPTDIKTPNVNWYVLDRLTENTIMIFFK